MKRDVSPDGRLGQSLQCGGIFGGILITIKIKVIFNQVVIGGIQMMPSRPFSYFSSCLMAGYASLGVKSPSHLGQHISPLVSHYLATIHPFCDLSGLTTAL